MTEGGRDGGRGTGRRASGRRAGGQAVRRAGGQAGRHRNYGLNQIKEAGIFYNALQSGHFKDARFRTIAPAPTPRPLHKVKAAVNGRRKRLFARRLTTAEFRSVTPNLNRVLLTGRRSMRQCTRAAAPSPGVYRRRKFADATMHRLRSGDDRPAYLGRTQRPWTSALHAAPGPATTGRAVNTRKHSAAASLRGVTVY